MDCVVYERINVQNGMWYVGKHKMHNWNVFDDYKTSSDIVSKLIDKFGQKLFTWKVLCVTPWWSEAGKVETKILKLRNAKDNPMSYNQSNAGAAVAPGRPLIANGVKYKSRKDACRALGISRRTIQFWCDDPRKSEYQWLSEGATHGYRYTDGENQFLNLNHMAKFHGIGNPGMRNRIKNKSEYRKIENPAEFDDSRLIVIKQGNANELISNKKIGSGISMRCEIEGIVYDSRSAAGRALGMRTQDVKHRCLSPNWTQWKDLGRS